MKPSVSRPTPEDLVELYQASTGPCVSIFLPTHRRGPDIRKDPIRLKNLLREATERLTETGQSSQVAESILGAGSRLVDSADAWRNQEDGLALFLAPGIFRSFQVPSRLPERVVVGTRFHLSPLLPFLPQPDPFHLLALSRERVRFFVGDQHGLREVEVADLPEELREVVGYDHEQKSLQFHTSAGGAGGSGGRQRALFHGHGAGRDDENKELIRFLQEVDHAIVRLVSPPRPPLVVAAVGYVAVAYRDLSKHGSVVNEILEGNPDQQSASELHQRVWPLVEPILRRPVHRARRTFEEARHTQRTGEALEEILPAGVAGRIEALLVAEGVSRWGHFEAETGELQVSEDSEAPGKDQADLVDRAAMECLMHGGAVFTLPPDNFPASGPLAAIYRF